MSVMRMSENKAGVDFVVGDIHGCFDLLREELKKAEFNEAVDRLFSVGDLVDRGHQSSECLDWLDKSWFYAVIGNHEQMAIDYVAGCQDVLNYRRNGGQWFLDMHSFNQVLLANAFMDLPVAIEIDYNGQTAGIIHADVPVADWADLEDALDGENSESFKSRCIWGRDKIKANDGSSIKNITKVICGHTPVQSVLQLGNVIYIDTGAVFGKGLTLIDIKQLLSIQNGNIKI